uniref:Type 1 phosphatases regulator n=1 Tax=Helicotheca tamesis TaxID=374047 RepID=A0A7S2N0T4_9STRA|mmetsp:Transcript_7191/g.9754  ORF Transcript_7191/g.9754 Transcript_7191/m.9754 type:complete len:171 (+) Transcript_7191:79-591(+)|eukprot:CAMPEP_0185731584 /NCGR_PEP_ID=MMETSP1171-20130828/13420_1 /TAXON_ID=374046 /ORGANISM="Helicotheca tamensis, Strain CCMP826" /LENGTH=170 /DNA_ID=CAMNT_0028400885 /DNA_START=52 /DNA_END=564 /DNA_ORIENTATION=+
MDNTTGADDRSVNTDTVSDSNAPSTSIQQLPSNSPPVESSGATTMESLSSGTATMTITETSAALPDPQEGEVLVLNLQARPSVTWDEDVVDNEGLGRKSSKRCCIFHKQRPFGESSTDSSDYDNSSDDESENDKDASNDSKKMGYGRKIARRKKGDVGKKNIPDYQRYHA